MTANIFISGFVQGVGFRHFVKSKANKLGVKGSVRNISDGKVEAVLQSSKDNIDKMITFCKQGPFLSEVKNVVVERVNSDEVYKDFEML